MGCMRIGHDSSDFRTTFLSCIEEGNMATQMFCLENPEDGGALIGLSSMGHTSRTQLNDTRVLLSHSCHPTLATMDSSPQALIWD